MSRYNESKSQQALMQWWSAAHRGLGVRHRSALYMNANEGKRTVIEGARMKAMGLRAGVPDLFLRAARGGYHGLYIEMKTATGRVREEQKQFICEAIEDGYWAVVARGWDQARQEIERYLKGATK